MTPPAPPFWFVQRQAKAEPAGENVLRLTAPNLREAFIAIKPAESGWLGALRTSADGSDIAASQRYDDPIDAWNAAFELYRLQFVV